MSLANQYVINVDLKLETTIRTPEIRRGGGDILLFRVFDNGNEYDISSATKAQLFQRTPSGTNIVGECNILTIDNKQVVEYVYDSISTVELGFNTIMLVITEEDTAISIFPFSIIVYDNYQEGEYSYVEVIQNLKNIISDMEEELENTVKIPEKGATNGVATLDNEGIIPDIQTPVVYNQHINRTVYKKYTHGFTVEENRIAKYLDDSGSIQDLKFADNPTTAVCSIRDLYVLAEINVINGFVIIEYQGVPNILNQKYAEGVRDIAYFNYNGVPYNGNNFSVSKSGLYTIWYEDVNGKRYTNLINVKTEDLARPKFIVSVLSGTVTVSIDGDVLIKRYADGNRDLEYFENNGIIFTDTFEVDAEGDYTIFYMMTDGRKFIELINITESDL